MLALFERYRIDKPIRLIELFAGYGSQALALENMGVEFEHHKVVEFDKYAVKSYNALHGTEYEPEDITQVHDLDITNTDKHTYIMTYSFPCQDLSLAGKGRGMSKGTRSGLLWEVERLLKENNLPQVLLMENVTQVHGTKHKEDFVRWTQFLAKLGYSNQWQDLNAKHYGIPQNRNRTFMVSILGDYEYHFPKPIELKYRLKDFLENEVDEKYYLSDKMLNFFKENDKKQKEQGNGFAFEPTDGDTVASAVTTRNGSRMDDNFIVNHIGNVDIGNNESNNRVYSEEGLSPTLNTMQGGHRQPKIVENTKQTLCLNSKVDGKQPSLQDRVYDPKGVSTAITTSFMPSIAIPEDTKQYSLEPQVLRAKRTEYGKKIRRDYEKGNIKESRHNMRVLEPRQDGDGIYINRPHQKRGTVQKGMIQTIKTASDDIGVVVQEPTIIDLKSSERFARKPSTKIVPGLTTDTRLSLAVPSSLRIRKLTPRECLRLMGLKDKQIGKMETVQSNAQLYKQAGNSIVVNVLEAIFREMME